jgi:hypothetical protein
MCPTNPPNTASPYRLELGNLCFPSRFCPPVDLLNSKIKMAKSKAKRKQQGLQDGGHAKKSKTSTIVTPPPDAGEPKTIQSVGLNEDDLDLAIDTLNTLAENPGVIKAKACKDLRTAVYEFRQACTTGFNAAGAFISAHSRIQLMVSKGIQISRRESVEHLRMKDILKHRFYWRRCGSEERHQSWELYADGYETWMWSVDWQNN